MIAQELASLERMSVRELRLRYAELFGDETRTGNKPWLIKRIAWRLQANEEGGLTERARQRAAELANDADLRLSPPTPTKASAQGRTIELTSVVSRRDRRAPPPGSLLTRDYKGKRFVVHVLEQGFECEGAVYKSLTAVAEAITGQHLSGHRFFGLQPKKPR